MDPLKMVVRTVVEPYSCLIHQSREVLPGQKPSCTRSVAPTDLLPHRLCCSRTVVFTELRRKVVYSEQGLCSCCFRDYCLVSVGYPSVMSRKVGDYAREPTHST